MLVVTVGYVLKKHKIKVLGMEEFDGKVIGEYQLHTLKIDPLIPLADQEHCDVIIHKIHDVLTDEYEIKDKETVYAKIKDFFKQAEDLKIRVLDIWDFVDTLNSRISCSKLMDRIKFDLDGVSVLGPPTFLLDRACSSDEIFKKLEQSNIEFPFLSKPLGGILAHSRYEMSIHFSNTSTNYGDIASQLKKSIPCAIQQFYKHGGILYKLYIVGDYYEVCVRPSIIDIDHNNDPIYFKSNFISRNQESCHITSKIDKSKVFLSNQFPKDRFCGLNGNVITKLIQRMREVVDLQLVGLDIIIETGTNKYYIVDINYFPGFKGIEEPRMKLAQLFIKQYNLSCQS